MRAGGGGRGGFEFRFVHQDNTKTIFIDSIRKDSRVKYMFNENKIVIVNKVQSLGAKVAAGISSEYLQIYRAIRVFKCSNSSIAHHPKKIIFRKKSAID